MSGSFNNSINPVWAKLVEALSFFCDQKKSSPSTSSGRTDVRGTSVRTSSGRTDARGTFVRPSSGRTVPVYKGQRLAEPVDVQSLLEARPIYRRLVREPCILPLGVTPRCLLAGGTRLIQRGTAVKVG